jgi:hypothetical protein
VFACYVLYRGCRFLVLENMGIESESGVRALSRRRVGSVGDYFGVLGPPEPLKARLGFRLLSKN